MSHPGHHIELCRQCKAVISQCRCPGLDKPVRYGVCETCAAMFADEVDATPVQGIPVVDLIGVTGPGAATVEQPAPQPAPQPTTHPAIWDLVQADIRDRDALGQRRYGQRLQPHDGRDALVDLYQELLDAVVYCRKVIYERDGR